MKAAATRDANMARMVALASIVQPTLTAELSKLKTVVAVNALVAIFVFVHSLSHSVQVLVQ